MARLGGTVNRERAVFINCPFDPSYREIFDAVVFAVCLLGFEPHCALEEDTGTEERLAKILKLIELCPLGIHDLSYMKLDPRTRLARHNMPFELGLFLGYEFASRKAPKKRCLILDSDGFRYRKSLSDLAGRDISAHKGVPKAGHGRCAQLARDSVRPPRRSWRSFCCAAVSTVQKTATIALQGLKA
jgi:hypothetical protein